METYDFDLTYMDAVKVAEADDDGRKEAGGDGRKEAGAKSPTPVAPTFRTAARLEWPSDMSNDHDGDGIYDVLEKEEAELREEAGFPLENEFLMSQVALASDGDLEKKSFSGKRRGRRGGARK